MDIPVQAPLAVAPINEEQIRQISANKHQAMISQRRAIPQSSRDERIQHYHSEMQKALSRDGWQPIPKAL